MLKFLESICKDNSILLHRFGLGERTNGVAIKLPECGTRAIAYNETLEGWEKIKVIAHEIGHHALGHLDDSVCAFDKHINKNATEELNRREREAEIFAAAFTAVAMFVEQAINKEEVIIA